jgi:hypothetical protein
MNAKAEEVASLEAVMRQNVEDTVDWEDSVHDVVNCRVCELGLTL